MHQAHPSPAFARAELVGELEAEFGAVSSTTLVRHAIADVAGQIALIEALDAELQARGYLNRTGNPRQVTGLRLRTTSRLAKARLELLELVKQERMNRCRLAEG